MGKWIGLVVVFGAIVYVGNYIEQKFKALERRVKALEERPVRRRRAQAMGV
jgi:hypothetical protein